MRNRIHGGFTLIEAAISLFVVGIIILLFANFGYVRSANRQTLIRAQAAALADEQINALRQLGFSNLTNQTNGAFTHVYHPAGTWTVVADGSASHSSPNSLQLGLNSSMTNAISGRLPFPAGVYDTAILSAKWRVGADSPSGWRIGYAVHSSDPSNGYRIFVAATGIDLDGGSNDGHNVLIQKISGGTTSVLWGGVSSISISTNTWYTLRVDLAPTSSPTIKVSINGTQQDPGTVTDTTFISGTAALLGRNGVHAYIDDVQTTVNSTTTTWDFDSSTDLPAAWIRVGLNTIPDATPNTFDDNGQLTIAAYPTGSTSLKQITVRINWVYGGSNRSYSTSTLIGQSDLGL